MKRLIFTFLILAAAGSTAAAQCVVYPGSLSVPANYSASCGGTWSQLLLPEPWGSQPPAAGSAVAFYIAETEKYDIPANQNGVTLIVTAPDGWEFRANPVSGASIFTATNGDIGSHAVTVTSSTIIVQFTSNQNTNKIDEIYIIGIDARPTDGIIGSTPTRYAYRTSATPGTAVMNGIVNFNGGNPYPAATRFMTLTLTPGDFSFGGYMAFTTQPASATACDTYTATLKTLDCAGNPTTIGLLPQIPVGFSAVPVPANSDLPQTINIGSGPGNFNGVADLTFHIRNSGAYKLKAESAYPQVESNYFDVSPCPPTKLVWVVDPIGDKGWMPLSQQPVLELQDEWGNASYAAGNVSLSLINETQSPPSSLFDPSPTMTHTAVAINANARAVFTDVQITSIATEWFRLAPIPSGSISGVTTTHSIQIFFAEPFPVELVSFSANRRDGKVYLNWKTATEADNYGFEIERGVNESGPWTKIGFMEGAGTSNTPRAYSFTDRLSGVPPSSALFYRLRQIDRSGSYDYSPVVNVAAGAAGADRLEVTPTVLKGSGEVRLFLNHSATITISVYDVNGREIAEFASGLSLEAGNHVLPLSSAGLKPGPYFLRCSSGSSVLISKFMAL